MANTSTNKRGKSSGSAATRFKKGAPSPNQKGRPRGSKNRNATIIKVLSEVVSAEMGGKKRKISVTEASLRRLSQSALKGDLKAIREVLQLWKETEEGMQGSAKSEYPFGDVDHQVIEELYVRMKACKEPERA